jgi:cyanophycinase
MPDSKKGTLVIIGGGEDKINGRAILKEVARLAHGKLVLATVASEEPEDYYQEYRECFEQLGIKELRHLYITERSESTNEEKLKILDGVDGVFFSGGDQLRISSQIGDTAFETRIHEIYDAGGVIAGTSAGASVMSEIMLIRGSNSESHRVGDLHMAAGLRLMRNVIIDQHFAERGRIGRLLGAVALNPRILGIGIDEDTAIVVHGGEFHVLGSGAVYVVDGANVSCSNIAESDSDSKRTLSIYDVRLHVMSNGDRFDLTARQPIHAANHTANMEKAGKDEEPCVEPKKNRKKSVKKSKQK